MHAVYDSEHMGGHLAVAAHFTNAPTQHAPGGGLQCAAWLSAQGWSDHPDGDACLAVAGADTNISGGWVGHDWWEVLPGGGGSAQQAWSLGARSSGAWAAAWHGEGPEGSLCCAWQVQQVLCCTALPHASQPPTSLLSCTQLSRSYLVSLLFPSL